MNAVREGELDVASLNQLRPEHAPFTLRGRMRSLLEQGFVVQRQQGLLVYNRLNPEHLLYGPLKRLLDRIGEVWPDMIETAELNDDLKPATRLVEDRNTRIKATKNASAEFRN